MRLKTSSQPKIPPAATLTGSPARIAVAPGNSSAQLVSISLSGTNWTYLIITKFGDQHETNIDLPRHRRVAFQHSKMLVQATAHRFSNGNLP